MQPSFISRRMSNVGEIMKNEHRRLYLVVFKEIILNYYCIYNLWKYHEVKLVIFKHFIYLLKVVGSYEFVRFKFVECQNITLLCMQMLYLCPCYAKNIFDFNIHVPLGGLTLSSHFEKKFIDLKSRGRRKRYFWDLFSKTIRYLLKKS